MLTTLRPRRGWGAVVAAFALAATLLPTAPAQAAPDLTGADSALLTTTTGALAPGLELTSFQRLQPGGWVTGHVITADLSEPTLSLDVVDPATVSGTGMTVSDLTRQAGGDVVAAVNGDYFDMNYSQAPVSTNVSATDGVLNATSPGRDALTIKAGLAAINRIQSASTVSLAGGAAQPVEVVNSPSFGVNQLGWFTPVWGSYPIAKKVPAGEAVTIVLVRDGVATKVATDRATLDSLMPLPAGTSALVARGTARARLAGVAVGTKVDVTVRTNVDADLAVSGAQRLVVNGVATAEEQVTAARTAVGVDRTGTTLYVASIDGRLGDAHGMTIGELKAFMLELGAYNAVNLDGGGSTTLVGRLPGTNDIRVLDRPSDGNERLVANALVFRTSAPAALSSLQAKPSVDGATTLMPGLSRTVEGTGLSTALGPVRVDGTFAASNGVLSVKPVDGQHAIVTGVAPGSTSVRFDAAGMTTSVPLTVEGPVARLAADQKLVSLLDGTQTATLHLSAFDADEHRAVVETRDVTVAVDGPVTVEAADLTGFRITPTAASGAATVTFTAAGRSVVVPVTIGTKPVPVATFADGASWTTGVARATGTMTPATGPDGQPALRLQYDFTTSTATRGFYALPPAPLPVPGQPQTLTMWVNGDGNGSWLRVEVVKGDGVKTNINGPEITWKGWQQVTIPVPEGTPYPLTVTAIRLLETKSGRLYRGDVTIAGLDALVPADVQLPTVLPQRDPVLVENGTVDGRPQRIAIISDAQFVAAAPDSALVAAARRTLREIVAAKPDFVFVVGDLVDLGYPADIALAKQVLDEELGGKVGYQYVPGNHEMYGASTTASFEAVFGPTHTVRDIAGTRFVTLSSATGNLHPGGSTEQLRFLEAQLADARTNPAITGVVVMHHHPIDDPLADKNSQLGDRYEAAALIRELAAFRAESGKSVAEANGHVGVFNGSVNDGVSIIVNGNSGKGPASTPADGGFTGWTMLGIDPAQGLLPATPTVTDRLEWLRGEVHARVDELTLNAPSTMAVGDVADVSAVLTQDGDRQVPVQWPVAAQWGGDVRIAPALDLPAVGSPLSPVAFDPTTRQLVAVGAGRATLTLAVNGVSRSVEITVTGATTDVPRCTKKGSTQTVTGTGFVPGATVEARMDGKVVGSAVAAADGTVSIRFATRANERKEDKVIELWVGDVHAADDVTRINPGNC